MKKNCFIGTAIFFLCSLVTTSSAFAVSVKCTWADATDGAHPVIAGVPTTLKAVVDSPSANITYQWSIPDGVGGVSVTEWLPAADPYTIETAHIFTGKKSTLYTATITVKDNGVELGTDTYTVQIGSGNKILKAIAIEDGLWYIHSEISRYTDGPEYGGAPVAYTPADWKEGVAMSAQAFIDAGFKATGSPDNPYTDNVQRIVNFVIGYLGIMPLTDKDGGGSYAAENRLAGPVDMIDGLGVYFAANNETEFGFGPALRLIATAGYDATARPVSYWEDHNFSGRLLPVPPQPPIKISDWTYHQIAQQMIDWIAWAQLVECGNDYSMRECSGEMTTVCYQYDYSTTPATCLASYESCDGSWGPGPPQKVCAAPYYPVASESRGGWPFYVEGWGRILPGQVDHKDYGDGTYSDAAITNWTLSGVIAAEANLGLVYPDYIKPEVTNFILANLGPDGEVKFGAAKHVKDIGRAGMGLSLMSWLGMGASDLNVQAQKNFINNTWNKNNYKTDQYYHEVNFNCPDGQVPPVDINCYSHFSTTDYFSFGHYEQELIDGIYQWTWKDDGTYQQLNLLSFLHVTKGLNAYMFPEAVPALGIDIDGLTYQERYQQLLLDNQQPDGSWDDYNWSWGSPNGTSFAIQTLLSLP